MLLTLLVTLYACDIVSVIKERETIKYILEKEGLEIQDNRNFFQKTKTFLKDYLKYLIPGSFLYYDIFLDRSEKIENRINELKSRNIVINKGEVKNQKQTIKDKINNLKKEIFSDYKKEKAKERESKENKQISENKKYNSQEEAKKELKENQKKEKSSDKEFFQFLSNEQLLRHYYKTYLESEKRIAELKKANANIEEIQKYIEIKNDASRRYNSLRKKIELEKLKEERNSVVSLSSKNENLSLRK